MSDWTGTGTVVSGTTAGIWTPTTLATHLFGEIDQDANAAGGSVPNRVLNTVVASYRDLWTLHEWKFRRRRTTLNLTAGVATVNMPADFEKFDLEWLRDANRSHRLHFTDDEQLFRGAQESNGTTQGSPELAIVEPAPDLSGGYAEVMRVSPIPDAALAYEILYLCLAPDLAADCYPAWPQPFYGVWEFGARARVYHDFRRDRDAWKEPYNHFLHLVERAKSKNDEKLASSTPRIRDDVQDLLCTASAAYLRGWIPIVSR